MSAADWVEVFKVLGLPTLLLALVIYGVFVKGWAIPGHIHRQVAKEKDEWKQLALRGATVVERQAITAEEKLEQIERFLKKDADER